MAWKSPKMSHLDFSAHVFWSARLLERTPYWAYALLSAGLFERTPYWAHALLSARLIGRTPYWAHAFLSARLIERTPFRPHSFFSALLLRNISFTDYNGACRHSKSLYEPRQSLHQEKSFTNSNAHRHDPQSQRFPTTETHRSTRILPWQTYCQNSDLPNCHPMEFLGQKV